MRVVVSIVDVGQHGSMWLLLHLCWMPNWQMLACTCLPFSDTVLSLVQSALHGIDNIVCLGDGLCLQGCCIRHGYIRATDALHGCVKVVECIRFHDACHDLGTNPRLRPATFHCDAMVRFYH